MIFLHFHDLQKILATQEGVAAMDAARTADNGAFLRAKADDDGEGAGDAVARPRADSMSSSLRLLHSHRFSFSA